MESNLRNFGILEGRLTREPKIFENKDGSKKIMVTLAVQDNFKNSDGKRSTQFIPVEAFISNKTKGLGIWDYIHKGDLIGVEYTVRSVQYEKDLQTVYKTVMQVVSVDLKERKEK